MPDSNVHILTQLAEGAPVRLTPALVTAVLRREVEVTVNGRSLFAILALPALYQPVAGDTVLLIEASDAAYVIGVLHATGPMSIQAPGDLHLLAPNGCIALDAASIYTRAPEMRLEAGRLTVLAAELRETLGSVYRVVRDLLEIDAGSISTRARALFSIAAGRLRATADQDVKINGERIHLG
jgi:hypothetical protein